MSIFDKFKKQASLNKRIIRSENILALDIGTEWVKALIFYKENGRIHTIGYGKSRQQTGAMRGAMITNLKNVKENCDLAVGEACKKLDPKEYPKSITLGIAGELVSGEVIFANYERKEPDQVITQNEINYVTDELKKQTIDGIREEIAKKYNVGKSEIVEISSTCNDFYINDYKVTDLVGFKGKKITFKIFYAFTQKHHLDSIMLIADYLGLNLEKIVVVPFAISQNFEKASSENFSGIFADIGAGTTDVALVNNGSFVGAKMFALGGRAFTQRIQKLLQVDYDRAEKIKLGLSQGQSEVKENDRLEILKYFDKDARVLVSGIHVALSEIDEQETYPTKIYLSGGGAKLSQIQEAIRTFAWLNYLPFEKFPKPELIYPRDMKNLTDVDELLKDIDDISVVAIALESLRN